MINSMEMWRFLGLFGEGLRIHQECSNRSTLNDLNGFNDFDVQRHTL